jgi:hypothetical protein
VTKSIVQTQLISEKYFKFDRSTQHEPHYRLFLQACSKGLTTRRTDLLCCFRHQETFDPGIKKVSKQVTNACILAKLACTEGLHAQKLRAPAPPSETHRPKPNQELKRSHPAWEDGG